MSYEKFKNKLNLQRENNLFREPILIDKKVGKYIYSNNKKILNFSSNDYLGLGSGEQFSKIISDSFNKYSPSSSSSRLVTGNYSIIKEAEDLYADYFGYESCLFFPSGYQANIALVNTLFDETDFVFYDKHVHASTVMGMKSTDANFIGYNHNSFRHLEKRVKNKKPSVVNLLTESLFSMDGDFLKKDELRAIKEKYNSFILVDEAHSIGAIGKGGLGYSENIADIVLGTFGKAFGFFGAFVLLPSVIKDYFYNFASPVIYSTTLPEAHAYASIKILPEIKELDNLREKLLYNSSNLKEKLLNENLYTYGDAHIIAVEIGDEKKTVQISNQLLDAGICVFAARFPTVPIGKSILRISMTSMHNVDDIDFLIKTLKNIIRGM